IGEHPTLIGDLVAITVAFQAIGPVEELIQQPGSPNLYWALTALPDPFIDLRKGLDGQRGLLLGLYSLIDETAPTSDEQLNRANQKLLAVLTSEGVKVNDVETWLKERLENEGWLTAARTRLVEHG